jgi:nicotinate-nucleotide adenylyltransferase
MNIAVFGGRFDPIHNVHLAVAREVLRSVPEIDEVWLLPANTHPWKPMIASAQERLAMVRLVEEDHIKASDLDIRRGGETYTIDTVRELLKDRSNRYYWVCGIDQIKDFYRWREYEELQSLIDFLVFPRKGYDEKTNLPKKFSLIKGDFVASELSSSNVREKVYKGISISDVVPKKVEVYIKAKGLYE